MDDGRDGRVGVVAAASSGCLPSVADVRRYRHCGRSRLGATADDLSPPEAVGVDRRVAGVVRRALGGVGPRLVPLTGPPVVPCLAGADARGRRPRLPLLVAPLAHGDGRPRRVLAGAAVAHPPRGSSPGAAGAMPSLRPDGHRRGAGRQRRTADVRPHRVRTAGKRAELFVTSGDRSIVLSARGRRRRALRAFAEAAAPMSGRTAHRRAPHAPPGSPVASGAGTRRRGG